MITHTTTLQTQPASPRRDAAVTARMADFMLHHSAANGSVDRDALLLEFSEDEIKAHFEAARTAAQRAGRVRSRGRS